MPPHQTAGVAEATLLAPDADPDDAAAIGALIQPHIEAALATLGAGGPAGATLPLMARYHLGEVDAAGRPTGPAERRAAQGKRLRPAVALLSCLAAGGDARQAAPLGAALELLHQFTLIHDDIQDNSPTRRHRPTVWSLWGVGQAINAGDAMHAAATLALYRLTDVGVRPDLAVALAADYARMTVEIVRGQVQDLAFEGRADVTPEAYLGMISGKTSAIVRYAAGAGARIAGADAVGAERFGHFGLALGLGFQIQDDLLGIWGAEAETGKAAADDIRRRKQSLPILLLRAAVNGAERAELDRVYAAEEVDQAGIDAVLELLDGYGIRAMVEARVQHEHDEARACLLAATGSAANPARDRLLALTERLAVRRH